MRIRIKKTVNIFKSLWGFLGLLALFRVLFLLVTPINLAGDEAYYWEWGQHLDFGYFSKPPGIAWLMALADWAGSGTDIGIRVTSVVIGTFSLMFIYLLGKELHGPNVGWIAMLVSVSSLGNAALNIVLTIDAPLTLFWLGSLYCFWRYLKAEALQKESFSWSLGLMFFLAAGLLSKQMMLVFYPLALVYVTLIPENRPLLKRFSFWMIWLIPLSALVPPILWNYQHQWITFTHTLHHFEKPDPNYLKQIGRAFEFFLSQLGLVGLVFYPMVLIACWTGIRQWNRQQKGDKMLLLFGGAPVLIFIVFSFWQRINANWPATFYSAAILFTVKHFVQRDVQDQRESSNRWLVRGVWVNIVITGICYIALFLLSNSWIQGVPGDPTGRIRGWKKFAEDLKSLSIKSGVVQDPIYISVGHRFITSELAFYLEGQPRVYRYLEPHDYPVSQHDFWKSPADRVGEDAVIIVQDYECSALPEDLAARFDHVEEIGVVEYPERNKRYRKFYVYHGEKLLGWPEVKF